MKEIWIVLTIIILLSLESVVYSTTECKFPIYSAGAAEDIPTSILSRGDTYGDSPLGVPLRENMMEYFKKDFRKLHKLQRHMATPDDTKWKQTQHGNNVTIVFLGGGLCAGAVGRDIDQILSMSRSSNTVGHISSSTSSATATATDICQQTNGIYSKSCRTNTLNKPCKSCGYPARFQIWIQKAYPHLNIKVYNLGSIGTNSQIGLANLEQQLIHIPKPIDIAVLDFTEADQATGISGGAESEVIMSASFERIIRYFGYKHHAVVINLEHSTHVSSAHTKRNSESTTLHNSHVTTSYDTQIIKPSPYHYERYHAHDIVISKYEIPTLRYEEHAFLNTTLLGQDITYNHHQLLANHLSFFWYKEAMKVCMNMRDHKEHTYTHTSTVVDGHDTLHPHHDHHMYHHRVPIMSEHKAVQDKIVGPAES